MTDRYLKIKYEDNTGGKRSIEEKYFYGDSESEIKSAVEKWRYDNGHIILKTSRVLAGTPDNNALTDNPNRNIYVD